MVVEELDTVGRAASRMSKLLMKLGDGRTWVVVKDVTVKIIGENLAQNGEDQDVLSHLPGKREGGRHLEDGASIDVAVDVTNSAFGGGHGKNIEENQAKQVEQRTGFARWQRRSPGVLDTLGE